DESERTENQGRGRARQGAGRAAQGAFFAAHADRHSAEQRQRAVEEAAARHRPGAYLHEQEGANEMIQQAGEQSATRKTNTRTLSGRVTSTKMQKTVTVLVERKVKQIGRAHV